MNIISKINPILSLSIGVALGVLLGQGSIILAFNPGRFVQDSIELAGQSYRLGCNDAKGYRCIYNAKIYVDGLVKNLNTRTIIGQ